MALTGLEMAGRCLETASGLLEAAAAALEAAGAGVATQAARRVGRAGGLDVGKLAFYLCL